MNDTAKKLREAAEYIGDGETCSDTAIVTVREMFDVGRADTFGGDLGRVLVAIADELDKLQTKANEANNLRQRLESAEGKAERRKKHIGYLNTALHDKNILFKRRGEAIARVTAENAGLRKRVPSERERQILDMWPKFEDGEPVMIGDGVDSLGGEIIEVYIAGNAAAIWNNSGNHMHLSLGERVKRPARSVPDADGVEIRVGDTVWHEDGSEWLVEETSRYGVRCFDGDRRRTFIPAFLTHTRPDSWERLEEDAEKLACAYLGRSEGACFGCPLENCKDFAACSKEQAKDIVRRAKALAGIEVE